MTHPFAIHGPPNPRELADMPASLDRVWALALELSPSDGSMPLPPERLKVDALVNVSRAAYFYTQGQPMTDAPHSPETLAATIRRKVEELNELFRLAVQKELVVSVNCREQQEIEQIADWGESKSRLKKVTDPAHLYVKITREI
jgi:hypothetical protein